MPRQSTALMALNRGEVSKLALARVDIEHLRLAAESQINWLPRVLGPMMLRPGTEYVGQILNNQPCTFISYVAAFDDTALIELTSHNMRIWRDDALITRAPVATTISDFPAWTTTATGTAVVNALPGALQFSLMNNGATAQAYTVLNIAVADQATEHALRFTVANGPVAFFIGSAPGIGDIFGQETLDTGVYSLAFTPNAAQVYVTFQAIQLASNANTTAQSIPTWAQLVTVENIAIELPGVLSLSTPWGLTQIGTPGSVPSPIRHDQSANIVFVAAPGVAQYQINRYSPTSWSIVNYRPIKGPMAPVPSNPSITIGVGAYFGNTTLTASRNLFTVNDVGTLFRIFSSGQNILEALSFSNTYTDAIRVTGVSYVSTISGGSVVNTATTDRNFTFTITGVWTGTIRLQRSFTSATTGFSDYQTYTTNQTNITITDGLNNEIVWYRIGFDPNDLVSGQPVVGIAYTGGGNYGVAHVTSYVSPTVVNVEVLVPFWGLAPVADWIQSEWSNSQGYPTSVAIHEGRLWWAGADKWWGSVSDDYSNFDYDAVGDAAPIDQSIGAGPIANINWLVSIDHLLAGADTSIITAMSDAIESPLTPTNFTLRRSVTNGSYQIQAIPVDQRVVYIDQSGRKLYALIYDIRLYNYKPSDLTRLNPDIGLPGFTAMAVQRQPDTRINLVRTDGIIVSFIYDDDDDVEAFWRVQTDGAFEAIAVLPGSREDTVYVCVNRTINGKTVRNLEKFSRIDECQGGLVNKNVDALLTYSGNYTPKLAGFNHLIGKTVAIWGSAVPSWMRGSFNSSFTPSFFRYGAQQAVVEGAVDFNADESQDFDAQTIEYQDIVTSAPTTGDLGTAVVASDGTVTIPGKMWVNSAVAGLIYQAEFISAELQYAAKMGSAMNKVKRLDHIGLSLVATHCQGVRYGTYSPNDPGNTTDGIFTIPPVLDDMPLVEYGADVPLNYIWTQYDSIQIELASEYGTDNRIYLQAASPRPATVRAVSFDIETSG